MVSEAVKGERHPFATELEDVDKNSDHYFVSWDMATEEQREEWRRLLDEEDELAGAGFLEKATETEARLMVRAIYRMVHMGPVDVEEQMAAPLEDSSGALLRAFGELRRLAAKVDAVRSS